MAVETALLLDGDVVAALEQYAQEKAIDLVVIATHARGALGRFFLGSVADDLAAALGRPGAAGPPRRGQGRPGPRRRA